MTTRKAPSPKRTPRRSPKRFEDDEEGIASLLASGSILNENEPIIYLHGPIDEIIASKFLTALSRVENETDSPLVIVDINTPGGDVASMVTMLSAMRGSRLKIVTYVSSEASSAGAFLLSAGEKGMRFASPLACVMIHEILCGTPLEPLEDTVKRVEFIKKQNEQLMTFMAKNCGKTLKQLRKLIKDSGSRDMYLSSEQALAIGIIDHIKVPKIALQSEIGLIAIE